MHKYLLVFLLISTASCTIFKPVPPAPKEEFRAVWIATVANIDWPKHPNDSWEKKQADYLALLDFYQALNFNAVILQVRTAGDALYPTALAPWSRYLTGEEGQPPAMEGDPLQWLIEQAHRRGMQFHAWLNPYRATTNLDTTSLAQTHDMKKHGNWMIPYGNKYYYNPGLPEVQNHLLGVVTEVATSYEVDGIHFDDYFYPYKIAGEEFADSLTYSQYAKPGQSLDDWRRANVDSLVSQIYRNLKKVRPWVQFGISPFGVWRNKSADPGGSDTKAGQTTYDDLYADPLKWMRQGWIDYLVPQIYWSMEFPAAPHSTLVSWWADKSNGTHLYIGNGAYKVRNNPDKAWERKKELPEQLSLSRRTPEVGGNVYFSAKSLQAHPELVKYLRKRYYKSPSLPPATETTTQMPPIPAIKGVNEQGAWYDIELEAAAEESWQFALIYSARKASRLNTDQPGQLVEKIYLDGRQRFPVGKQVLKGHKAIALSFLDVYGRESRPIIVHLDQTKLYDQKR